MSIVPFLKWAGGKRWLVRNYSHLFDYNFNRYFEPFLGSGSVFFYLKPKVAYLSDTNEELINTYNCVKENWKTVHAKLNCHQSDHTFDYYYKIREDNTDCKFSKAANFIYLNRTCWNGLYRVNLGGKFNVPIGTKTNVLLPSDDFEAISQLLAHSVIEKNDFSETLKLTTEGDLIFADPPYTVKHNNNGFLKYNEKIFSWEDQLRLHDSLAAAKRRGVKIILTNADHESIAKLYEDEFTIHQVTRHSVLAGSKEHRRSTTELVIMG